MTPLAPIIWRAMTPDDLDATQDLAAHIHADYPESHEVFTQRLAVAPEGCHVLASPNGIEGYLISHPWQGTLTPALNTLLPPLPAHPDRWYIHDLALSEAARGQGFAQQAITLAEQAARARKLARLTLVSTRHALRFWYKQGFEPETIPPAEHTILASYDPEAQLLSRALSP
ncbi:GNAT family N-acetyltransferase [Acetobacter orientalis]|uniref:GNAT family N-acetyltransferase n=1 Tax=Acetobacter orientalis TaxID=146474 RepID=UPI0039E80697